MFTKRRRGCIWSRGILWNLSLAFPFFLLAQLTSNRKHRSKQREKYGRKHHVNRLCGWLDERCVPWMLFSWRRKDRHFVCRNSLTIPNAPSPSRRLFHLPHSISPKQIARFVQWIVEWDLEWLVRGIVSIRFIHYTKHKTNRFVVRWHRKPEAKGDL